MYLFGVLIVFSFRLTLPRHFSARAVHLRPARLRVIRSSDRRVKQICIPPMCACVVLQNAHAGSVSTKRRKWILVLAVIVAAVALTAWLTREREPTCKGKTLTQWLDASE